MMGHGPGCPCCGSPYGRQGCTFDYGCHCKYYKVCPESIKARSLDNAVDAEAVKKILKEELRRGEKCGAHCGHVEHHPGYKPPAPPAPEVEANAHMRDGW